MINHLVPVVWDHAGNVIQKQTKQKLNAGKSIIDICSVPEACCATEYPDCSLLYSYPSEGGQVIGGNGADQDDSEHRCWRSCSAEEMLGLTASARRAQTVWAEYWGANRSTSSYTWLIWRSKWRSNLPEWSKAIQNNGIAIYIYINIVTLNVQLHISSSFVLFPCVWLHQCHNPIR